MNIQEVEAKSCLIKSNLPLSAYCINPYIGCQHGCVYCYAKFMRRFTKHKESWGSFIDVRINCPEILEKQLSNKKVKFTTLIGSVTDAYQPLERKYNLTRKILKIIVKHQIPISVLTKSNLILRDIDLYREIENCTLGMTITSLDDEFRKKFEPFSSPVSDRIKCLKVFHEAGIKTYAYIGPIFPEIIDYVGIIKAVSEYSDVIMAERLNIRSGNWKNIKAILDVYYPSISNTYKQKLAKENTWKLIEDNIISECQKNGVTFEGLFSH